MTFLSNRVEERCGKEGAAACGVQGLAVMSRLSPHVPCPTVLRRALPAFRRLEITATTVDSPPRSGNTEEGFADGDQLRFSRRAFVAWVGGAGAGFYLFGRLPGMSAPVALGQIPGRHARPGRR